MRRVAIDLVLFLLLASLCAACATVQPWQRGVLADRRMQLAPTPERGAARQHVFGVREAAQGGLGGSGSACGCD